MPRFLQLVALSVALLLVGVPTVIAEIAEIVGDDCAEECAGEQGDQSCPDTGCTDCSIVCPACARTHVVAPSATVRFAVWRTEYVRLADEHAQRVPAEPTPQGVFHPPRVAG